MVIGGPGANPEGVGGSCQEVVPTGVMASDQRMIKLDSDKKTRER